MRTLLNDIRYGARRLGKSPGFTATATLILALGIGANTAIFSVINALLLRPLPVKNPSEIVSIYTSDFSGPLHSASSYPDFEDMRAATAGTLSGALAYSISPVNVRSGDRTERLMAEFASEQYFTTLGVEASVGRVFSPDQARAAERVAVLSHGYWLRRFGGNTGIIGQTINVNGNPFVITGVAPAKFYGAMRFADIDVWLPLGASQFNLTRRGSRGLMVMGRLRPGKTVDQLQAQLNVLATQLHKSYPRMWADLQKQPRKLTVVPESGSRVPARARTPILAFSALLSTVVGLVLLIACANIASLLLARATARRREIGIRLALGAGRKRLIAQLLTENVLLALMGGVAGMCLAVWLNSLLMSFKALLPVSVILELAPDARVLLFATSVCFLSAVLFGLAPALQATRNDILSSLKESTAQGMAIRKFGFRNLLVAGQMAASFVLLIGAGLFLRSLQHAYNYDPGFRTDNMLLVRLEMGGSGYTEQKAKQLQTDLVERIRMLPGVQGAELAKIAALGMEARQRSGFNIQDYTPRSGEDMELYFNVVGPRYFETMGLPLVRGRSFSAQDRDGAPQVAIVNEAFANRYWPGQDPIGKHVARGERRAQVIGIARNSKYLSLTEEQLPYVYLPILQTYERELTVHVRTAVAPASLINPIRTEIAALDKDLPLTAIRSFSEHLGVSLLPARIAATLLSSFGLVGLLLAATGLYGVIAYAVTQRTREIGIRVAMGAQTRDVLKIVVMQGMAIAIAGIAAGTVGAFAAARLIGNMLFGVSPADAATYSSVGLMLAAVALIACIGPARRAARVDPLVALRIGE